MAEVKMEISDDDYDEFVAIRERFRRKHEAVACIDRLRTVAATLQRLSAEMVTLSDAFAARVGALEAEETSHVDDALDAARKAKATIVERGCLIASMDTLPAQPVPVAADLIDWVPAGWRVQWQARENEDAQCWDSVLVER